MAIFFDKVPREIRNHIYQLLLVDQVEEINLSIHPDYRKDELYPAILCTCKKAYMEGSAVLYDQNRFRYAAVYWKPLSKETILGDGLVRIKHVRLLVNYKNNGLIGCE